MAGATDAKIGIATKLQYGDGASPEVFATVVQITKLTQNGREIDLPEKTNMDSPSDPATGLIFREYIPGLAKGGTIDFTANYLPGQTTQEGFQSLFDGKLHNWRITLPLESGQSTQAYWAFSGFVTSNAKDYPIDKPRQITGKVQITGPDLFHAGV